MAVVLVLGVLTTNNIVQSKNIVGCSNCTSLSKENFSLSEISELSNTEICQISRSNNDNWKTNSAVKEHVREAAKRKLSCGITQINPFKKQIITYMNSENYKSIPKFWCENLYQSKGLPIPTTSNFSKNKCPGKRTLVITKDMAIEKFNTGFGKIWLCNLFKDENDSIQFNEKFTVYSKIASLINLKCKKKNQIANLNDIQISEYDYNPKRTLSFFSDKDVCDGATKELNGQIIWNFDSLSSSIPDRIIYLKEAKLRNLNCRVNNNYSQKNVVNTINSEELKKEKQKLLDSEQLRIAEEKKRKELEKKLAALEKEVKSKDILNNDASKRLAKEEKQKRLKEEQLRLAEKQKRKELEKKLAILSKKNNVNVDNLVEDTTAPVIYAQSKRDGFYANISGTITDDVKLGLQLI